MEFKRFCQYLSSLEKTSKRLEIAEILSRLIKELDENEVDRAIYLTLGMLGPLFANQEFAIAEKMLIKILARAFNEREEVITASFEKEGDLGNVAQILSTKTKNKKVATHSVFDLYQKLLEIAKIGGSGSQEKKILEFSALIKTLDPLSARFIVRIPIGTVRLGFSEVTIIEALSWLEKGDKSLKSQIEAYYNVHPDIGLISKLFKKGGLKALRDIELEVGVPVLPQLCQRVGSSEEAIEKLAGEAQAEYKFDGTRVQLHVDKNKVAKVQEDYTLFDDGSKQKKVFVKTYTRNLEDSTHMFPDLINASLTQLDCTSVILDGEAVGFDPKTKRLIPFQETSQRKRKHNISEKVAEIPVRYYVFDLLYLNGKSYLDKPLKKRREALAKILKKSNEILIDEDKIIRTTQELINYFQEAKEKGLEGIVIKKLDSTYEAGGRGFTWIKFKREEEASLEDSIDGVILGYYFGKGARSELGIGGFLVGVYDKESGNYLTACKVGSGPTEKEWKSIKNLVDSTRLKERPEEYVVNKTLLCDVWSKPKHVVVIRADELSISDVHSTGYSLRFPRLVSTREDKRAEDTTGPLELKRLFELQKNRIKPKLS
ncbi:MAG: ATP-dependent DNA ligase [Patescibacteria group bacterium]